MTIGPLKPDTGSEAAQIKTGLRESKTEKPDDHDSTTLGKQVDRVELSLDQRGDGAPRVTYSLDEVLSGISQEAPLSQSSSQLLSDERLMQIRNRIEDGYYNRSEIIDEIAGKLIDRTQENE